MFSQKRLKAISLCLIYPDTNRINLTLPFVISENIVLRSTNEDSSRNWIPEIDKSRNKVPARAFFIRVINHINNDILIFTRAKREHCSRSNKSQSIFVLLASAQCLFSASLPL